MQIGNVFVKVVARRLQIHSKAVQFMVLAGYDDRLSHTKNDYVASMGAASEMTPELLAAAIDKARIACRATGVIDVTNGAVANKLAKMFEQAGEAFLPTEKDFATMGIGRYM